MDIIDPQKGEATPNEVFFSVIVPIYNSSRFISRCICSILAQSFVNWEAFFLDDCSTDNTVSIVRALIDDRCQLIENNINRGPSVLRNMGILMSRGKYIVILDSDDWMAHNRLQVFYELIMEKGEYTLVADQYLFVGEKHYWKFPNLSNLDRTISASEFIKHDLGSLQPVMNREFLINHNISYNETIRFAEDFDIYLRILAKCGSYYLMSQPLYYRQFRADSLSRQGESANLTKRELSKSYFPLFSSKKTIRLLQLRIRKTYYADFKIAISAKRYQHALWLLIRKRLSVEVLRSIILRVFGNKYKQLVRID